MQRRISICVAIALAALAGSACRGDSSHARPRPVVSDGAARALAATACGSVRALRTVAAHVTALLPTLHADSGSRLVLKLRLVSQLGAAGRAADAGASFLEAAREPHGAAAQQYRASIAAQLRAAASDFARWHDLAETFVTNDRDNWEDQLNAFERKTWAPGWNTAWRRVERAARGGTAGAQVAVAITTAAACRGIGMNRSILTPR